MGNLDSFSQRYHQIQQQPAPSVGFAEVSRAAQGHWDAILPGLGVDAHSLHGKHCACPGCGGKDRFRFDNKDGNGTFVCSQGNGELLAGDGFMLLEHVNGWNRSQSFQAVRDFLGLGPSNKVSAPPPVFPKQAVENKPEPYKMNHRKELSKVKEMWGQGVPIKNTPAETYLAGRGILTDGIPDDAHIRFHRWLTQYAADGQGGFRVVHEGPAMIALVTNVHEEILGIHKTFIKPDGSGKANIDGGNAKFLKKCVEKMNGGAVRIHLPDPNSGIIGVSEGIESALSAYTITRRKGGYLPVVAALNTTLLSEWIPPIEAKMLAIMADNDKAGLEAAQKLKTRMQQFRPDVDTDIIHSHTQGYDWNDELLQKYPMQSPENPRKMR